MKNLINITIFILVTLSSQHSFSATLRQAATHYPPFTIINGNTVHGIDMEIIHKMAQELGHT